MLRKLVNGGSGGLGVVVNAMVVENGYKDLTRDLRRAVSKRVRETGLPSLGHGAPFILTENWRDVEYRRISWILRFLLR